MIIQGGVSYLLLYTTIGITNSLNENRPINGKHMQRSNPPYLAILQGYIGGANPCPSQMVVKVASYAHLGSWSNFGSWNLTIDDLYEDLQWLLHTALVRTILKHLLGTAANNTQHKIISALSYDQTRSKKHSHQSEYLLTTSQKVHHNKRPTSNPSPNNALTKSSPKYSNTASQPSPTANLSELYSGMGCTNPSPALTSPSFDSTQEFGGLSSLLMKLSSSTAVKVGWPRSPQERSDV